MSDFMKIGSYQLQNLINARSQFHYLDLSEQHDSARHPLLAGSRPAKLENVVVELREAGVPADGPIVLICENGAKSMVAAEQLAQNSFINVFVVESGIAGL